MSVAQIDAGDREGHRRARTKAQGDADHERGRPGVQREDLRRRVPGRVRLHGHGHDAVQAAPHGPAPQDRASSSATTSSNGPRSGRRRACWRWSGWAWSPGMADVFARYAEIHLFDTIDEIGVRDGANLEVRGYEFAPNFSIWTTIEECLNPPVIWEKRKGWYTTETFSEPEVFDFPEGIGPVECVNVEHEEVLAGSTVGEVQAGDLQVRPGWSSSSTSSRPSTCLDWTTRTRSTSRASRWPRATWWRHACRIRLTWAIGCSARRAPGPG